MISLKAFYYVALLVPFGVRLIVAPSFFGSEVSGDDTWYLPSIALVPYASFVALCWFNFRNKTAEEIGAFLAFGPLCFAVLLLGYFMLKYYYCRIMGLPYSEGDTFNSALFLGLWSAFLSICIGYAYTFVVLWLEWVLLKCRIISEDDVS